jgi:hypothetical protein
MNHDLLKKARQMLASQGGKASADALTPEQRKARAIKARAARTEKARRAANKHERDCDCGKCAIARAELDAWNSDHNETA